MTREEIKHLSTSYYNLHEKYYKLQEENKQLKDNWNKLREFINLNYYDGYMYSSTIINKMQELENGDSNE